MTDLPYTRGDTDLAPAEPLGLPSAGPTTVRTVELVEALAASAAQGSLDALGQLYELTVDSCYRYLYVRTHSHHLSEEITSQTWLSIVHRISSYRLTRRGGGFSAWMFTIAKNKLVDHYRSKAAVTIPPTPTVDMVEVWVGRDGQPYGDQTVRETVTEALGGLPPRQREVVVLRNLVGLTLEEAAATLGRRPASVRQAHARAMRKLQSAMSPAQPDSSHTRVVTL